MLQDALWRGLNVEPDADRLRYMRSRLRDLINKIPNIKSVHFTEELKDGLKDVVHHEQKLYIRLAIGWHIMHGNFDSKLILYNEQKLQRLIEMGVQWKHEALSEAGGTGLLVNVLRLSGQQGITVEELQKKLAKFEIDWQQLARMLNLLREQHRIYIWRPKSNISEIGNSASLRKAKIRVRLV